MGQVGTAGDSPGWEKLALSCSSLFIAAPPCCSAGCHQKKRHFSCVCNSDLAVAVAVAAAAVAIAAAAAAAAATVAAVAAVAAAAGSWPRKNGLLCFYACLPSLV